MLEPIGPRPPSDSKSLSAASVSLDRNALNALSFSLNSSSASSSDSSSPPVAALSVMSTLVIAAARYRMSP